MMATPQKLPMPTKAMATAFWQMVTKPKGEQGHWYFAPNGTPANTLGRIQFGGWARTTPWRMAYTLTYGGISDEHNFISHSCTDTRCVNPRHLIALTAQQVRRKRKQHGTRALQSYRSGTMQANIATPPATPLLGQQQRPPTRPVTRPLPKLEGREADYPTYLTDTGPQKAVAAKPQQQQVTNNAATRLWVRMGMGVGLSGLGCCALLLVCLSLASVSLSSWVMPVVSIYLVFVTLLLVTEVYFRGETNLSQTHK